MLNRAKALLRNLSQSLGFVPGVVVVLFAVLGIVLVEVDGSFDSTGVSYLFQGDGSAARTVLSVIAGSLITVAGLTFSITMVVLQLASSQFSPRVLRTFFADRITQVTIGTFVGTFLYALLVLRAVGSFGDAGFVPRLSVTVATLFGIASVILLIVFLNHVAQMIQVSHVTSGIARDTLARTDKLYPETFGEPREEVDGAEAMLRRWREDPSGLVHHPDAGYVQRVGTEDLPQGLAKRMDRLAVLVSPGDFVSPEVPTLEVWPAELAEECRDALRSIVSVGDERDLDQDVGFGMRQLTDTALKAMSPGINDPQTAVTCIGYLRAIAVRLSGRADPPAVRRFPEHELELVLVRRRYEDFLEAFLQIDRYVEGDAWVAGELLTALAACADAARRAGAEQRLPAIREAAETIVMRALEAAGTPRDRDLLDAAMRRVEVALGARPEAAA